MACHFSIYILWAIQYFLKILFTRFRDRAWVGGGIEGQGQVDSMLSGEPDLGLDHGTLRSWLELKPKVVAQPNEPLRTPEWFNILINGFSYC